MGRAIEIARAETVYGEKYAAKPWQKTLFAFTLGPNGCKNN
jgi:hypothetical protein